MFFKHPLLSEDKDSKYSKDQFLSPPIKLNLSNDKLIALAKVFAGNTNQRDCVKYKPTPLITLLFVVW